MNYDSTIKLGEKYEHPDTGLVGTATSIHFYQHACERVTIRMLDNNGELQEYTFDSPELVNVQTRERSASRLPGGPARAGEARNRTGERR